jgi:hypothetical protein
MRHLTSHLVAVLTVVTMALAQPAPAAAQAQGASCATNGTTAPGTAAAGGQNLLCSSGTWQYVPYQFGNSAANCPGTGNANLGMVKWTGSLFQGCEPSGWTTFSPCTLHLPYVYGAYPDPPVSCCPGGGGLWGDGTYIYQGTFGWYNPLPLLA